MQVVHSEFLPTDLTINEEYYLAVIVYVRLYARNERNCGKKTTGFCTTNNNTPAHTSLLVRKFLSKNSTNIIPQPPFRLIWHRVFFLFPKLKLALRGHRFESVEDIKANSLQAFKTIPKSVFSGAFEEWKNRWHKCFAFNRNYFEGNKINIDE